MAVYQQLISYEVFVPQGVKKTVSYLHEVEASSQEEADLKFQQEVERLRREGFRSVRREGTIRVVYNFNISRGILSYVFTYPNPEIVFKIHNPRFEKDQLKCYLIVTAKLHSKKIVIYQGNYNFYSNRSTADLIKEFSSNAKGLEEVVDLKELIETFKRKFIEIYTEEQEAIPYTEDFDEKINYLIYPFVLEKSYNLFFAPGASGKSTFAVAMSVALASGHSKAFQVNGSYRVLYLDYENNNPYYIMRLAKLLKNSVSPEVLKSNFFVKPQSLPVYESIEKIADIVSKNNIDVIVIDSVAKACGTDLVGIEGVNRFFSALSKIPVTYILISHVAKADENNPYGSVFFRNFARNVFKVKTVRNGDKLKLIFIHDKANYDKLQQPIAFELQYSDSNIIINKTEIQPEEDQTATPLQTLIVELLKDGAKTLETITELLPAYNPGAIKTALTRLKQKGTVARLSRGLYGLVYKEE